MSPLFTARHEFLESKGIRPDEIARAGEALALSELNMRFMAPLRSCDRFRSALQSPMRVQRIVRIIVMFMFQLPRKGDSCNLIWCCRVGVRVTKISAARATLDQEIVRQPATPDELPQVCQWSPAYAAEGCSVDQ